MIPTPVTRWLTPFIVWLALLAALSPAQRLQARSIDEDPVAACEQVLAAEGYTWDGAVHSLGSFDDVPVSVCLASGPPEQLPVSNAIGCLLVGGQPTPVEEGTSCTGVLAAQREDDRTVSWLQNDSAISVWVTHLIWNGSSFVTAQRFLRGKSPALAAGVRYATGPDWELLSSYTGGVLELRALPSGQVVGLGTEKQLVRSGDDGDSWQPIPTPAGGHAMQVDPRDPSTVYGSSPAGILKSADAGVTWRVIYPSSDGRDPIGTTQFAISPVDRELLYFAHPRGSRLMFDRSRDGGATWERTWDFSVQALCNGYTRLLVAHATDARVVFTDLGCYAGRNRGTSLLRSDDQGNTWQTIFRQGQDLDVGRLSGGTSTTPGRLYLAADAVQGAGPARLFRSDDSGARWTQVLQADDPRGWRFGGLASGPTAPDTVWAALGSTPNPDETGVRISTDAGQNWAFLGRQDIGWVNDLVRTADGQALLAATNEGIWRYRLAPTTEPTGGD